ncbi:hypothetical protein CQA49_08080 [Helicobacter sp. MIT 00-7814]|uniref:hypothetical protein n=1 Tax=unclassified Helicobacter TaxID=2593540 RepID=UPI000E1E9696|nr:MULTISPECIES: hypothetical protein [unclassified Helicobacter]RDU51884.1 hypothetical protein CQA37_09230 [Helicobacter sp. MIT 99-10781]RDU52563.1 hypothetical protein CQA49_08080 [Helicobacter sp. MIT 00-7814]
MRVDTSNLHRASAGVQQAYQNMQNTPKADIGASIAQGAKGIADSLGMYLDYQSKGIDNKAREIALTEQEKTSQTRIESENNKNELAKVQAQKDIELTPLMKEAQMQQLTAQAGMFKKINESDDLTKTPAQKAKATQTKAPAQKTQTTPAQPQATTTQSIQSIAMQGRLPETQLQKSLKGTAQTPTTSANYFNNPLKPKSMAEGGIDYSKYLSPLERR